MASPPRRRFSIDSTIGSDSVHPTSAIAMAMESHSPPGIIRKRSSLSDIYRPQGMMATSPPISIIPRSVPGGSSDRLVPGSPDSFQSSPPMDSVALASLRQFSMLRAVPGATVPIELSGSPPEYEIGITIVKIQPPPSPAEPQDRMKKKMMTAQYTDF